MIILSVGMPRAGSGWFYNLTNDLAVASGFQDARAIRKDYHLEGILTEVNCNIGVLSLKRLTAVMIPSLAGKNFVIKAHAKPTQAAKFLIKSGAITPAYIYRDPRDAMLSAMENGSRARESGRTNAFSQLDSFEAALNFMKTYVQIAEAWFACQAVLHIRYEDLLLDYDREANRLNEFFGFSLEDKIKQSILDKYRPESAQHNQKGLHYQHGKIGRFRQKMTSEQQKILNETFNNFLERQGYPI